MRKHLKPSLFIAIIALCMGVAPMSPARAGEGWTEVSGGMWIPFLPDYTAGSIVSGGVPQQTDIFSESQTDVGGQLSLRGFYHFLPTRTMIEYELGIAGADGGRSSEHFSDPGPTQGVWFAAAGGGDALITPDGGGGILTLDSKVFHHNQYIGLRDRFDLSDWGIGVVDIGCGFSHLAFDQDFEVDTVFSGGLTGQLREDLDSNFVGGEFRSTFVRPLGRHELMFDFDWGLFDFDAQYKGNTVFSSAGAPYFSDAATAELKKTAFTVDLGLRLRTTVKRIPVTPGITFKYISDMPTIEHPMTVSAPVVPVSLSSKAAYVLGLNIEILL